MSFAARDVSDVRMYRDGGTILFRVSGTEIDGGYRLQTPFKGTPRPLFRNEIQLVLGSLDEWKVIEALTQWLDARRTPAVATALEQLRTVPWRNLPPHLDAVVPEFRIELVVAALRERQPLKDANTQ
ncbi:MAG: hypothetical protein QM775_13500 [Pirellulales bacterium]